MTLGMPRWYVLMSNVEFDCSLYWKLSIHRTHYVHYSLTMTMTIRQYDRLVMEMTEINQA